MGATQSARQRSEDLAQGLFDALRPIADESDVPGFAVSVRDRIDEHTRCHGRASQQGQVPVSPATRFQVGSVSKIVCAHLVLDLIDAGSLSLDDPIGLHVPEFSPRARPDDRLVSVDDLLSHRSGFDGDYHIDTGSGADALDRVVPAANSAVRLGPPGQWYSYSNLGYALLGLVVQRVTGQPFEDVARNRVLGPCSMSTSGYHWQRPADRDVAVGHRRVSGSVEEVDWSRPRCRMPNGGLVSSVGDLTLLAAHLRPVHASSAPSTDSAGFADGAGPLSFVDIGATGTLWWHDGGTPGFRSILGWSDDIAVAMACNANHGLDLVRAARSWMQQVLVGGLADVCTAPMPAGAVEVAGTYRAPSVAGYHDLSPATIVIAPSDQGGYSLLDVGVGGHYQMRWSNDRFSVRPSVHGDETGLLLRERGRVVAIGWQGRVLPRISNE
jgi:CubicO group peptidase (beta-lactamase class C family)